MRVSVVVCTYSLDMYEHFCEVMESIFTQQYDDVEVIVVVDGTEPVYERAVEDYGKKDDVVIYCNSVNSGLLRSRNKGVELASGDVVAFIDDDAIADEYWVTGLVHGYKQQDALAVGGKMTPEWVAGKPFFLPPEFYWLVGVTHRTFPDEPGWVRNTFGSNISFRRDIFLELGGFDPKIGGRKEDKNLQGGETELCARLEVEYGEKVWYNPAAKVAHKIFKYRTEPKWLLNRAFWQGYSKRAMEVLLPETGNNETEFLRKLFSAAIPDHLRSIIKERTIISVSQLLMLFVFTAFVGLGYLYGLINYR